VCTLLVEYVPSLQTAVAPAGAPAGARTVGICEAGGAELDAADAALGAAGRDELEVGLGLWLVEDVAEAFDVVGRDEVFLDVMSLATPPWLEHRPLETVAVE